MLNIMRLCLGTIARLFCARRSLLLENLALRQQLAVFKRRHPRTRLTFLDKLFWVAARQIWSDWKQFLIVVLHRRSMAAIRVCALLALNFQGGWTGLAESEFQRRSEI
jgi:hypothetical protein